MKYWNNGVELWWYIYKMAGFWNLPKCLPWICSTFLGLQLETIFAKEVVKDYVFYRSTTLLHPKNNGVCFRAMWRREGVEMVGGGECVSIGMGGFKGLEGSWCGYVSGACLTPSSPPLLLWAPTSTFTFDALRSVVCWRASGQVGSAHWIKLLSARDLSQHYKNLRINNNFKNRQNLHVKKWRFM